jgi:membrane-associated PAP2 superfamily phosphatase
MAVNSRTLFSLPMLTACALALLVAWDNTGLDMALAQLSGGPAGFPLRDSWLLENVLHEDVRKLSWAAVVFLCVAIWWPVGPLRRLTPSRRTELAVSTLAAVLGIVLLKAMNHTSCPWDLVDFGGVARHVSHWATPAGGDGGGGRCFPAGHASSGFAFVGGYFVFRRVSPALARTWLACALLAGLGLGIGQQLRGAHFMSHTLWTGWACWVIAWGVDLAWDQKTRLMSSMGRREVKSASGR